MSWKLKRTAQCEHCPWRVETDPFDIPDGYDPVKHAALKGTIAVEGSLRDTGRAMACHETDEAHCMGWLSNQLGPGNKYPAAYPHDELRERQQDPAAW